MRRRRGRKYLPVSKKKVRVDTTANLSTIENVQKLKISYSEVFERGHVCMCEGHINKIKELENEILEREQNTVKLQNLITELHEKLTSGKR